jgi:hypothetical protein
MMTRRDVSTVVEAADRFHRRSDQSLANFQSDPHDNGDGGAGPPGGGGMERRFEKIEGDLVDLKVLLARIEAKLDSKIDYKWLTLYVLGIVAVVLREEIAEFLIKTTGG